MIRSMFLGEALRRGVVIGMVGAFVLGLGAACSFKSSLENTSCEETGVRKDGKVCRNGFWVSVRDASDGGDACAADEICSNDIDDDCDGVVNNGCPCSTDWTDKSGGVCDMPGEIGEDGECGPPESYADEEGGSSGTGCQDSLDNDCDGTTDENCRCNYDGRDKGVCLDQPRLPDGTCKQPEDYESMTDSENNCDGADNDCDGAVDEGCPCNYKGNDTGVCKDSMRDASGTCKEPDGYQSMTDSESCESPGNRKDNDCDGVTDEGCNCNYNGLSKGICSGQTRQTDGTCPEPDDYVSMTDDESPHCDGADNDCDGDEDEGCVCTYQNGNNSRDCPQNPSWTPGQGVCKQGTQTCKQDGTWGACQGAVSPSTETCSAGISGDDEDCDGTVDENCPCVYDPTQNSKNVDTDGSHRHGVCTSQLRDSNGVCQQPNQWMARTNDERSKCDGMDNDCDGATDEGCRCVYDPTEGDGDKADSNGSHQAGVCTNQRRNRNGVCKAPTVGFAGPQSDSESSLGTCDGPASGPFYDNDCDGVTDEGCPCVYDPDDKNSADHDASNNTGVCTGESRNGSGVCSTPRHWNSTDDENAANECDGRDNDCDGVTDENCPCIFDSDMDGNTADETGVCTNGTIDSTGTCQPPNTYNSTDDETANNLCDNKDNDCDGATDEQCSCVYDPTEGDGDQADSDKSHVAGICTGQNRNASGVCQAPPQSFSSPQSDSEAALNECQGPATGPYYDNDCDGAVDEQCPCVYDPDDPNNADVDASNDFGVCRNQSRDASGTCQQPGSWESTESNCTDGVDTDCDGYVDCGDDDCSSAGPCNQRIFVTSVAFTPGDSYSTNCGSPPCGQPPYRFDSVSEADAACNDIAARAGLSGTWRAIISGDGNDAGDPNGMNERITVSGTIYNMKGAKLADNEQDLWNQSDGYLDNPVQYDETGQPRPVDVWTGTQADGSEDGETCESGGSSWNSSSSNDEGEYGNSGVQDEEWIFRTTQPYNHVCDGRLHLYCIDGQ